MKAARVSRIAHFVNGPTQYVRRGMGACLRIATQAAPGHVAASGQFFADALAYCLDAPDDMPAGGMRRETYTLASAGVEIMATRGQT